MFEQYKKIAILGFGKEGASHLRFLRKNGIGDDKIDILDKNISEIEGFHGKIISGETYLQDLGLYDCILKSPGVSPYQNHLLDYKDKIKTQTQIFFENYKGKIISVTQTKGKSTTVTLCYELLKNAGYKVKLVGNIGAPVLDEIDILNDTFDFVVYELSSYMLEELQSHHSFISIIGNIYPDHLDWHNGFENYKNAKLKILNNAQHLFIGEVLSKSIQNTGKEQKYFTFGEKRSYYGHQGTSFYINQEKIPVNIIPRIPGDHNLHNFCAILGLANVLNIPFNIFEHTINNFGGLPHRLEKVGIFEEITFIDDAISTTPESTLEAIKSFDGDIDTIFLGGSDRGYQFENFVQNLKKQSISNIVLFPESGEKIKMLLPEGKYNLLETRFMEDAVDFAFKHTKKGKICLLSTASPSYSIWKNFEEKGDLFKKYIYEYANTRKNETN